VWSDDIYLPSVDSGNRHGRTRWKGNWFLESSVETDLRFSHERQIHLSHLNQRQLCHTAWLGVFFV